MPEINIPKGDYGKVHVFALSMDDDAAQALVDSKNQKPGDDLHSQARVLGTDFIDPGHVEVFRVADLGTLGLAGYLREGVDANEDEITRDAAKLAAVDGWVMLVYSNAFGGSAATLNPIPDLTHLGSYGQEQADRTQIPLESDAAAPYTGTPAAAPPVAPRGRAGGSLVVIALIVLAALFVWWAFS